MTTYNTGNPIGSTDPKDLYDNAEAFDRAINDSAATFTDRLGNERPTLKRLETDYPLAGVYADEAAISAENAQLAQTGAVAAQASAVSAQLAAEAVLAGIQGQADEIAADAAAAATAVAVAAKDGAVVAKTAAETARDAAFVNANVYADTTAGLAATTNGQQFQVVSGDTITRYQNNSGVAVAVATYPAGGAVNKIAMQLGRAIDQNITSGSVGDTTPNLHNLGAGTYAPVNLCPVATILKSVSFRVSGAGTFEIHAYKKLTDTSWQCTAIWAGSTTASNGSMVTLTAGGGVIPSNFALGVGDFIAFKSGTCFIKYASGDGFVNLNSVGAVGTVVTRTLNTNGYAISIAFDYEGVGDNLQAQVTALGARTTTLEAQDVSSLQNAAAASASLLVPGIATPFGWKNIGSKIAGLPVIAKTASIKPLLDIFANGEKGFAVFANGGPLFTDAAKTDFADTSLDPVRVIADASPRNTSVAATADAKRPLLKFTGTGIPYLEFDGSDDALEIPAASFGSGAMAFVCSVALRSSTPSYPTILAPLGGGYAGGIYAGFQGAAPRWAITAGAGNFAGTAVTASAISLNTRTTLAYIYTGSQLQLYVNGVLAGSVAASGNYVVAINHALCQTQGFLASPIDFFGGVFVDRNITTTERQYLEGLVGSASGVPNESYLKSVVDASAVGNAQEIFTAIQPNIQAMVDAGVKEALLRVGVNYDLAPLITSTKAYSLGDSTVADYSGLSGLVDLVSTSRVIVDIATPGDTIAGQKSKWLAQTIDPALVGWVVVQIGLNDMDPTDGTTASKIAALQDLVNTIRTSIGSTKKLLIAKMLPCRQRYIDIYGATNGPIAQQRWVDVNAAIAGEGSTPITGVDARITAHVPLMDDGNGNLKAIYDTGDKIHPNLAGRQLMADEWKKAIWALGLVV